jgi:hypothetical protein
MPGIGTLNGEALALPSAGASLFSVHSNSFYATLSAGNCAAWAAMMIRHPTTAQNFAFSLNKIFPLLALPECDPALRGNRRQGSPRQGLHT